MNTFPAAPPVNRKELFARVSEIIQHGLYDMEANFAGTGRTGAFLEKLLGKQADSQDIADSTGWEIKTFALILTCGKQAQGAVACVTTAQSSGYHHLTFAGFISVSGLCRSGVKYIIPFAKGKA